MDGGMDYEEGYKSELWIIVCWPCYSREFFWGRCQLCSLDLPPEIGASQGISSRFATRRPSAQKALLVAKLDEAPLSAVPGVSSRSLSNIYNRVDCFPSRIDLGLKVRTFALRGDILLLWGIIIPPPPPRLLQRRRRVATERRSEGQRVYLLFLPTCLRRSLYRNWG